jgi:ABC-type phosphate transport system substrate-binding protein
MPSVTRFIRSHLSRPRVVAALLCAMLLFVTAMTVAPSAGAVTRTLTVTPGTGLTDQVVHVSWTGFTPTTSTGLNQVIVVQCKGNPRSLDDCYTAFPFPNSANGNEVVNGVTQPNGAGSVAIEIRPTAQLPDLGCNQANPCTILAYENQVVAPGTLPTLSAMAPIAFAKSTADCPPVTRFDVRAEGEASASPVFYSWAARRCTGTDFRGIDYTETSSDAGRGDFLQKEVDVGVTSVAATDAELKAAPGYPAFAYAPVDMTAVAVVFNMHDAVTNQPITSLTLSPRLLARLISDTSMSTFFQDPEFLRLNPGHAWPYNGASPPLLRAEHNADTWFTTGWIASNANAEAFLHGTDPDGIDVNPSFKDVAYPTSIFENRALDDSYLPREGEYQVVTHVFYGARPADTSPLDPASTGFIGIVDLPAADRFDLPTAKLVNATGAAVAPTTASITAGYHAMVAGPDGTLVPNFASTDPTAYPLVKVDYAMVPKQTDAAHQKAMRDLLTWGTTTGQEALPPGYLPLSTPLVDQAKQAAADISAPASPTPTTRPAPTTTTPSEIAPLPADACCSGSAISSGATTPVTGTGAPAAAKAKPDRLALAKSSASTAVSQPSSIGPAAARLALPIMLGVALIAALAGTRRRLWLRVRRPLRAFARIVHVPWPQGTPSGTA